MTPPSNPSNGETEEYDDMTKVTLDYVRPCQREKGKIRNEKRNEGGREWGGRVD